MAFTIGQKVCLWQIELGIERRRGKDFDELRILKEVIVTVTEIKTGVLGEWTRKPVSSQSLRGIGDDGKTYEKHWGSWPESQTNDFLGQWSMRDDGDGGESQRFWIPGEAVDVYNAVSRENRRIARIKLALVNTASEAVKPKGDIIYCEAHDHYEHAGTPCFHCHYNIPTTPSEPYKGTAVK
ncbi:MAG: hypothetical protein HYY92_00690 [Parcubacteria group bacterium]|nr:hypothetical protein [Parcubacteria group bacterium]